MTCKNLFVLALGIAALNLAACTKKNDVEARTKEELEEKIEEEFKRHGLSSLAYSLVKGEQLLHSGAWGHADKATARPATDSSVYLIASVSKLITGVALMQLVEQGRIALDNDINDNLPFSVRNPNFPQVPITYRMLLSHFSSISDDPLEVVDLDCYGQDCPQTLAQFFEGIFQPTGAYYSADNFSNNRPGSKEDYSNVGSALIGYLVERITQTPFDAYCRQNIFDPLGMNKTSWRLADFQPLDLVVPYSKDIPNPANPHYTFPDYPNGGLRTTVLDLSFFLRACINGGSLGNARILSAESLSAMSNLQFGATNQALAFYYANIGEKRVLGHDGGEKGSTTALFFAPQSNVGVIVFNSDDDAPLERIIGLLFNYGERQ